MLSITTKSPYAVRALAELARSGVGPVPIGTPAAGDLIDVLLTPGLPALP